MTMQRAPGCPAFLTVVLCGALLAAFPSGLSADWRLWLPRPVDNGAYLESFGSYESDSNRIGILSSAWTDLFFKEKLTLFSDGYIYHPKFLQYRLTLGGLLSQEQFKSPPAVSGNWSSGTGLEYNARLFLLPEHHYNLRLFAQRVEPIYKEKSATQHDNVETSKGVLFQYRNKPHFLHARYTLDSSSSSLFSTEVREFAADGQYYKDLSGGRHFSVIAAATPKTFTVSSGLTGHSRDYSLTNDIFMRRFNLYSSVTRSDFRQADGPAGPLESDQFLWMERLRFFLPWHFETLLEERYQKNSNNAGEIASGSGSRQKNRNNIIELQLIHRLYRSLENIYTFRDSRSKSTGGRTNDRLHSLVTNYTKSIPTGRLLAGFNLGRDVADSKGGTSVIDEEHQGLPVPGSFLLAVPYADPVSIRVFLRSPLPPYETIPLEENVHYTVSPVANSFQITVLALPPRFVVPGTFNLLVSYSVTSGTYRLRTDSIGFNASLDLLRNLLTPYYSLSRLRAEVLSGRFPGTALDSDQTTAGLIIHRGPLRITGEYQRLNWSVSPYRAWRFQVDYVDSIDAGWNVNLSAGYLRRRYQQGTAFSLGLPYGDETASASGNLQKQLFAKHLLVSAGGSYSRLRGLSASNGYSLNSTLIWKVGKLDLTLGAVRYWSDATISTTLFQERDHAYYYFNLRRDLF